MMEDNDAEFFDEAIEDAHCEFPVQIKTPILDYTGGIVRHGGVHH